MTIQAIYYKQDKEHFKEKFEGILSEENLKLSLNYLSQYIEIDQMYDFYTLNNGEISDEVYIYVDEIIQVYENDNFDYLISGVNDMDESIEIKLSQTEFWTG